MRIDLLCEIIVQGGRASSEAYRNRSGYGPLLRGELLQEIGVVQSVVCADCDTPHDAEFVHYQGQYGYWCPELGFVQTDRAVIQAVSADLTNLVGKLADTFDCKRRKSTPVQGATWRVGAIETPAGDVTIYLHPRLMTGPDVHDAEAAIRSEIASSFTLVLTAAGSLQVLGTVTAYLGDVVELDTRSNTLVAISDVCTAVGAIPKRAGGAPSRFEAKAMVIISSRARSGESLDGRNEEASAVREAYKTAHPDEPAPKLPTVKQYVTAFRGG